MTHAERYATGKRGALTGLAAYSLLAAVKLVVGFWAGSRAMVADGINNVTDVVASVAVLVGLRVAVRPADAEHRYGHWKAETLAALLVSAVMGAVGLEVAVGAAGALLDPAPLTGAGGAGLVAAVVAAGAAALMLILSLYNRALGRRLRCEPLAALAYDQLADALASTAALVGVVGARFGLAWLDPLAGLVVAGFILRTAYRVGREGAHALMDGFDTSRLRQIRERVSEVAGVQAVHDVRARQAGPAVLVDVTIGVDHNLTVAQGHDVAEQVERKLDGFLDIAGVMVHVEPARGGRRKP